MTDPSKIMEAIDLAEVEWDTNATTIHGPIDFKDGKPMVGTYLPMRKVVMVRNKDTRKLEPTEKIVFSPCILYRDGEKKGYWEIDEENANGYRVKTLHADAERFSLHGIRSWLANETNEWEFNKIYDTIRTELTKYFEFSDTREYDLVTCWIIGTYFHRQFNTFPYLFFNGTKQCGKTKLLGFLSLTAFNAVMTLNQTPANLFRMTQELFPTFLLDETEKIAKKEENDYRSLLLSRYKKGATIFRQEEQRKGGVTSRVSKRFEVYGPTALANIAGLDDVLEDRAIGITLIRSKNSDIINSEIDFFSVDWQVIRDQLYFCYLREGELLNQLRNHHQSVSDDNGDDTIYIEPPDVMMINTINTTYDDMPSSPPICVGGSLPIIVISSLSSLNPNKTIENGGKPQNDDKKPMISRDSPYNIFNEKVRSRSRELWSPIVSVATYRGKETLNAILSLAVEKTLFRTATSNDTNEEGVVLFSLNQWLKTRLGTNVHLKEVTEEVNVYWAKNEGEGNCLKPREVMTILKRLGINRTGKDAEGVKISFDDAKVTELCERLGIDREEK